MSETIQTLTNSSEISEPIRRRLDDTESPTSLTTGSGDVAADPTTPDEWYDQVIAAAQRFIVAKYHEILGPWAHTNFTQKAADDALLALCFELTGDRDLRGAAYLLVPELREQFQRYTEQTWKRGKVRPNWRDEQPQKVELPKFAQQNFDMSTNEPPARNRLEEAPVQKGPEVSKPPAEKRVSLFG